MHRSLSTLLVLGLALGLIIPARAAADVTLGTTTQPQGSTPGGCSPMTMLAQQTSDASSADTVPAPGGEITEWQTNTAGDSTGALTLVVLRPNGDGVYTVVAFDPEVIPNPLPADGIATFTPETPLRVQAGDVLGLYTFNGVGNCAWLGVSDAADRIQAFMPPAVPAPGDTETPLAGASGFLLDLAATLAPDALDAGVTATAGPPVATVGQPALLNSTVADNGPGDGSPITFTDLVPSGLTVDSAVAGDGTCAIGGQAVTCTINDLPAGQSVPVEIVVTAGAAGAYTNHVSVAPGGGVIDPNLANDSASATLSVASPPPAAPRASGSCTVPTLTRVRSRLARAVLSDLGCRVRLAHTHSRSVRKGAVVRTDPGRGRYRAHATITLILSSGPRSHRPPRSGRS